MSDHRDTGKELKSDCTMCRFVLYFSFAVLLLVLIFTFVLRLQNDYEFGPLASTEVAPPTPLEWDEHLTDLRRVLADTDLSIIPPPHAPAMDANFFAITKWESPPPFGQLPHGEDVVISGEWQLPLDWVGNIYAHAEGKNGASTTELNFVPIKNLARTGGVGMATGTFVLDLGKLDDGEYEARLLFWGGEECAVNTLINARYGGVALPSCPVRMHGTHDNFVSKQAYPPQAFTVKVPKAPRLTVTPNEDPALELYASSGGSIHQSFRVQNTGDTLLTGGVSGFISPFYCYDASCDYSIAPGKSAIVNVGFSPQTPGVFFNVLTFSCASADLPCENGSVTRAIRGHANGVSRAIR